LSIVSIKAKLLKKNSIQQKASMQQMDAKFEELQLATELCLSVIQLLRSQYINI
jgi:hypothetical protein